MDHVGPMTRCVEDAALLLGLIAGRDRSDPTSAREPVDDYLASLNAGVRGLRLGLPENSFREPIDPAVLSAVDAAGEHLARLGAQLVRVNVPDIEVAPLVELGICTPEATAWHHADLRRAADQYQPDVRTLLELGELYSGTHYLNAQRARSRIKESLRRCYQEATLDGLLVPTLPVVAPSIGQRSLSYADGAAEDTTPGLLRLCLPFNLSGQPALTLSCGFNPEGLPIGLGIVGRPFAEAMVLRIGQAYERTTEWHRRKPVILSQEEGPAAPVP
jgi:aspartyl-tRNA(Asn)/glutamyl-tRNA(Gln) amidotransferase subunit A